MERVQAWVEGLRSRGFKVTVGIVHHGGGVASQLLKIARSYRVELLRCASGSVIDLVKVLRRFGPK